MTEVCSYYCVIVLWCVATAHMTGPVMWYATTAALYCNMLIVTVVTCWTCFDLHAFISLIDELCSWLMAAFIYCTSSTCCMYCYISASQVTRVYYMHVTCIVWTDTACMCTNIIVHMNCIMFSYSMHVNCYSSVTVCLPAYVAACSEHR